MNIINLSGRITKDIELRYTTNDKAIAKFNLAVRRDMPNANGEYESDFINCISFNKTAEILAKYTEKGSKILVEGRIQTGNYEGKDGKKIYTTDVIVDKFEFLDKKATQEEAKEEQNIATQEHNEETHDPFKEMGDKVSSEDLPF